MAKKSEQTYPTIVYSCPGNHRGPMGSTYRSIGVNSAEEVPEGFYHTMEEAIDAWLAGDELD